MRFMPPQTGNKELDFFLLELSRAFQNRTGLLQEEADGLYDPIGAADDAITEHLAQADPHRQYVRRDQMPLFFPEDSTEESIMQMNVFGSSVGGGSGEGIDGGYPDSVYGGTTPIDGGGP